MNNNQEVINDYGKKLTEMKKDWKEHVSKLLDQMSTDVDDLSEFDVDIIFGDKRYKFGLTSSLSESMEVLIDGQLEEWGHDQRPSLSPGQQLRTIVEHFKLTNGELTDDIGDIIPGINNSDVDDLLESLDK